MWRTRVGYAGGEHANPTYRNLGDQTECFEVDFDPRVISYGELVDLAFAAHNPTWSAHKTQYASLVLARGEEQLRVARERATHVEARLGRSLATRIELLKRFWPAEDYHQKYHLRQDRVLAAEFRAAFDGDEEAFRDSASAARCNGYVAGDGTKAQLSSEIEFLGLSPAGRSRLIDSVSDPGDGIGCPVR